MTERVVAPPDVRERERSLARWFADRHGTPTTVTLQPGPQATGHSHETIVFDVTRDGRTERLVARVEPTSTPVFPDPDSAKEYRLLGALTPHGLPLPQLHAFEPDASFLGAPFYVMQHLEGNVPPDTLPYTMAGWLHESSPEHQAAVWWSGLEATARVHAVDPAPLAFVNDGRPVGIDGELAYWERYVAFCGGRVAPVAERAWSWLVSNAPRGAEAALCWGDSRLGNQMFRDGACVALLDWEMACVADPVQDLAWFLYFDDLFSRGLGVARLPGFPSRAQTIARYEVLTGRTADHIDYYDVFAGFRFTVILQRLGMLQIATGQAPPDSTFPTDNFATTHLTMLCDEKGVPA